MKKREIEVNKEGEDILEFFKLSEKEQDDFVNKMTNIIHDLSINKTNIQDALISVAETFSIQELMLLVYKQIVNDCQESGACKKCVCYHCFVKNKKKDNNIDDIINNIKF